MYYHQQLLPPHHGGHVNSHVRAGKINHRNSAMPQVVPPTSVVNVTHLNPTYHLLKAVPIVILADISTKPGKQEQFDTFS